MSDYASPQYSPTEVNRAGRALAELSGTDQELAHAITVIDNWRASHSYPLQSFYMTLKRRACRVVSNALTAQRIKRLVSITFKLVRSPQMNLTQMQDIGGCRAILPSVAHVRELEKSYRESKWDHKWLAPKDYISHPKDSGYRGIHLKYRFAGKGNKSAYDGLKIEIQIRTALQHTWATAVEAADTFTKQAIKASQGKEEWKRFFALMSSVFALREHEVVVPNTSSNLADLVAEIKKLDAEYHIAATFMGYRAILPAVTDKPDATYFLVTLDPVGMTANIKGFKRDQSKQANAAYTEAEKSLHPDSKTQIVLVSAASINSLKKAYPNYFMDTDGFLKEVVKIIEM